MSYLPFQLHRLEQAAGLHTNADKTEHMCFNQKGASPHYMVVL